MTAKIKYLTAAAFVALMTTNSAFAGEIEVGGTVVNSGIVIGGAFNQATGAGSRAEQNVGSISGDSDVKVGGNVFNSGFVTGGLVNSSTGAFTDACQEVGSIGNNC